MVGLVLGVIRLPFILSTGLSVTESVGTNIGVRTLGAITAAIQHIRNKNTSFPIFIIMALTGAIGAFYAVGVVTSQRFRISQLSSVTNSPTSLR